MRLFLFEFATCGGEVVDQIAVEGLAMFKTLYKGFSKYYEIVSFIGEKFRTEFNLPVGKIEDIESWLEKSEAFLLVAPEDDFTLLRLTRIAEKYCENLGSSSKAIEVTSDKWKLYKKLKGKIPMPKTSKKELDVKFIVKPRVSCGGEGIKFSNTVPENYIAQEYIEGKNLSASVIVGEEIRVVSINEQILENFRYKGAIVPARVEEGEALEICEVAINAVESIKGLKGYVGVDLVYSDQPYVVEVNARITTPVVAFERAYGISVADMLMGQKSFTFRRQIVEKGKFNDFFAKVGDFSLRIRDFR